MSTSAAPQPQPKTAEDFWAPANKRLMERLKVHEQLATKNKETGEKRTSSPEAPNPKEEKKK